MPHLEAAIIRLTDDRPPTRHFVGGLPENAQAGRLAPLPWPRVAFIIQRPDGVFLERFTEAGEPCGDTWHVSVEAAKEQAAREYGALLMPWQQLPGELDDDAILDYVREHLAGI